MKRRGWTQVADGRSSQANASTSRCCCDRHSTDKTTQSHIRQSFDCKRNPGGQGLGCGLVRRGCHLLVNWWNCSPGNRSWRKGREKDVGRKTPYSSPSAPPQTHISQSCFTTVEVSRSVNDTHIRTHFYQYTSHTAPSCLTPQNGHATVWGWGQAWGPEWQAGRQASPTEHRW